MRPEMVAIAHPRANDARLPRPRHGQVRGLPTDHLAEPELTVDEQHRALVHDRLGVGTHFETPAVDVVYIDRRHADAVGVMALEIGLHEVVRDLTGGCRLRARNDEDLGDKSSQPIMLNEHGSFPPPQHRIVDADGEQQTGNGCFQLGRKPVMNLTGMNKFRGELQNMGSAILFRSQIKTRFHAVGSLQ